MRMKLATLLVGSAIAVMTVAPASAYTIDSYPGNPPRTANWCDEYARDWADYATERGHDATVGALIGGTFGTIIGSAGNRPLLGGLIGGGIGAGIGIAQDRQQWEQEYNRGYQACIGGYPLPYPWLYDFDGGRYVAGSPEWYNWCSATYGSYFDPSTGTYRASDGNWYPCVVP